MLSWVYPVAMLVQRIVYEKEQRLKEVTKLFTNFETENYSLLFVLGSYIWRHDESWQSKTTSFGESPQFA